MKKNYVIRYACELEDIPESTADLLSAAAIKVSDVEALFRAASTHARNYAIGDSLKTIDVARKVLLKADQRLEDCYAVLTGYSKATVEARLGLEDTQINAGTQEVVPEDILDATGEDNDNTETEETDA
jgi:hypothetical protein